MSRSAQRPVHSQRSPSAVAAADKPPNGDKPVAKPSGLHEFQDWYEYEQRLARPLMMKLPEFQRHGRLRHVINSKQFDLDLLDRLNQITTKIRDIGETREGQAFLASLCANS